MATLIESSTALRAQLGNYFHAIKGLDPIRKRRNDTYAFRRRLLIQFGSTCGLCHRKFDAVELEAAHIVPLEIGGLTVVENLIILCKQCHRAFDGGQFSINYMRQVANDWRHGIAPNGRPMPSEEINEIPTIRFQPPISVHKILTDIGAMTRMRKYAKASRLLERQLLALNAGDPAQTHLQIKLAELQRRRSAKGAIEQAHQLLSAINTKTLSTELKSQYFYEFGYVLRLLGCHSEAAELMRKSAYAAKRNSGNKLGVDYVAAAVNEIICQLATEETLSIRKAADFENRIANLRKIALSSQSYWGGRWALNCDCDILQVHIKSANRNKAWASLELVRNSYFNSEVRTGWDIAARQGISLLEGLMRVLFARNSGDISSGVELLARAFITRLGRRQRQEGVRDAGYGLAIGLRMRGEKPLTRMADTIEKLMDITVDGTSVLWPWRAAK